MILTFVQGLFWVVTFPVWSGDEEGAHYAYEQSVATGREESRGRPKLNSVDTLRLIKQSPVATERTWPLPPTPAALGHRRRAVRGLRSPLYYVLLIPVYWAGRAAGGAVGSLYALRVADLCMAVVAIPMTALLARALLPKHRSIWLLAPAAIAVLQIVNVQNSYIDNSAR